MQFLLHLFSLYGNIKIMTLTTMVSSFPRLWITASLGQRRRFARVPPKWSHSLILRVTTSTWRPPSLASPATVQILLCWSSAQILALVSIIWLINKVPKIWKHFYFDLLGFNFNVYVFKVRNLLEFKYNPSKMLDLQYNLSLQSHFHNHSYKNNLIFEIKQSWRYQSLCGQWYKRWQGCMCISDSIH